MTSLDVSLSATSFPSILTTVIHQAGCYPVMLRACYRQARVLRLQSVQSVRGVQSVQHPSSFSLCAWTRSPVRMASTTTNSSNPEQPAPIRFSEGEDTVQVTTGLNDLRQRGWQLDADGMGILKTYYFKSYFKAVSFVNTIAAESAVKKHHAVITLRFGSVDVHWTTHNPRGLSQKDVTLAEHCERGADLMGAVAAGEGQKCH